MVTLEQTQQAMLELVGNGTPNGKLAFWFACLSTRNRLENNVRQALVMRQYTNQPLPADKEELRKQLGAILTRTLDCLYTIETLWNEGAINFNCGDSYEQQCVWREKTKKLIPGMGMKTISWALHIYAPFNCHLLTIDCWHCRAMGEKYGKISESNYVLYEQQLLKNIEVMKVTEGTGYPVIVYAACIWARTRNPGSTEYPSHAGLSCYAG